MTVECNVFLVDTEDRKGIDIWWVDAGNSKRAWTCRSHGNRVMGSGARLVPEPWLAFLPFELRKELGRHWQLCVRDYGVNIGGEFAEKHGLRAALPPDFLTTDALADRRYCVRVTNSNGTALIAIQQEYKQFVEEHAFGQFTNAERRIRVIADDWAADPTFTPPDEDSFEMLVSLNAEQKEQLGFTGGHSLCSPVQTYQSC